MAKHSLTQLTQKEIIARLEKPKSMRYIRTLMKPIFQMAKAKFGNAIVDIVEREHWGPNFDAYYDVWVRRQWEDIREFFTEKLLDLQLKKYVAVLTQSVSMASPRIPRNVHQTASWQRSAHSFNQAIKILCCALPISSKILLISAACSLRSLRWPLTSAPLHPPSRFGIAASLSPARTFLVFPIRRVRRFIFCSAAFSACCRWRRISAGASI
jgi:hypothetical protein